VNPPQNGTDEKEFPAAALVAAERGAQRYSMHKACIKSLQGPLVLLGSRHRALPAAIVWPRSMQRCISSACGIRFIMMTQTLKASYRRVSACDALADILQGLSTSPVMGGLRQEKRWIPSSVPVCWMRGLHDPCQVPSAEQAGRIPPPARPLQTCREEAAFCASDMVRRPA
jgi:hypothetical protein